MPSPGPRAPRRLGFYRRLSREQKREYDRSDALPRLALRPDPVLARLTGRLIRALEAADRSAVAREAQALVEAVWAALARRRAGPAPAIKVLRTRPRRAGSEFHGLYTRFADGRSEIRVWMLTAAHGQVVRPRTFLRTLLHEVCHHVDMTLLDLPSSFHTLGFHARESSLVQALERGGAQIPGGRRGAKPTQEKERAVGGQPVQLDLFPTPAHSATVHPRAAGGSIRGRLRPGSPGPRGTRA